MNQTSIPAGFYDSIMMLHTSASGLTTWSGNRSNTLDLDQHNFWHNLHSESCLSGPSSSFHVWLPECQSGPINRHMQCSHVDQCWASFEPGEIMNMSSTTQEVWSSPNTNSVKRGTSRRSKTSVNLLFQQATKKDVANKSKSSVNKRDLANIQERQRMHRLNDALDRLRKIVPMNYKQKRVSKIQILHGAIAYIRQLEEILEQE